jgi:hypothetical protein
MFFFNIDASTVVVQIHNSASIRKGSELYIYMIYNLAIVIGRTEKTGMWAIVPPKVVSGIYL